MPAQSPTLSPTLSAITAGLRGSSSGMPASTLPTRSAPTSAALVKMPPPRRAKIEIRSEEHTSELQSLMRISYAVFCLKKKKPIITPHKQQTKKNAHNELTTASTSISPHEMQSINSAHK